MPHTVTCLWSCLYWKPKNQKSVLLFYAWRYAWLWQWNKVNVVWHSFYWVCIIVLEYITVLRWKEDDVTTDDVTSVLSTTTTTTTTTTTRLPPLFQHWFSTTKKWKSMTYRHNRYFIVNDIQLNACIPELVVTVLAARSTVKKIKPLVYLHIFTNITTVQREFNLELPQLL